MLNNRLIIIAMAWFQALLWILAEDVISQPTPPNHLFISQTKGVAEFRNSCYDHDLIRCCDCGGRRPDRTAG